MKKITTSYLLTVLGLILTVLGLVFIKTIINPQGIMLALPYICIGIGCGIFGHGVGNVINNKVIKNNPDIEKKVEIEKKDERNIAIANKAKAKAYNLMIFVFATLIIAFALMGIDMIAVLILIFAYMFIIGYGIFYRLKYDKEM